MYSPPSSEDPLPPSSIYLCSHLNWEALQARPLFAPRWAHQRGLCVCLYLCECVCVSEGGMWEFNGGWCDLRLCAIWSCKAKRLNTARHWLICFLITLHLMWISFVPLKEQEGTCTPPPSLSLCVSPSLSFAHTRQLCASPLGLSGWGVRCPTAAWGGRQVVEAPSEPWAGPGLRFLVLYKHCHSK